MTGTTAEGRQAYALLSWANDDPSRRASEALDELGTLADRLVPGTSAFREVNNVGAVLARLEGAVSREPVRLSGTSIFAQFIELAWDPLKHPRDPHTGKFIGHGGAAASAVKASVKGHPVPSARAADRAIRAQMKARPKGSGPSADIGGILSSIAPGSGGEGGDRTALLEAHVKALQSQLDAITKKMDAADKAIEEEKSAEEKDRKEEHRADLAVGLGSVIMGVAISAFLGDASLSVAGVVPFVLKQALDRAPEIAKELSKFHIVGKGHGRAWAAHPIAKPAQAAAAGMRAIRSSPKVQTISQQAVAGMRSAARTLRRTPSASS